MGILPTETSNAELRMLTLLAIDVAERLEDHVSAAYLSTVLDRVDATLASIRQLPMALR